MNEIEITVKANFSTKISLAKTIRRICIAGMLVMTIVSQVNFGQFKTVQNPENIAQTIKSLKN
ncbi:hypothetical protein [Pseudomonas sp. NMI542_15]|uniref:hypothetical protein n=1 Tax=Pseudomonas sp. NMI542_15 TaxID=2903148 RepID=UPI001E313D84|nr:hypothetical protein [Pseudomonas sp. NMI542_15]MCE0782891.1 hypothetical protein [Pseudomonas sp. NMI542_15]